MENIYIYIQLYTYIYIGTYIAQFRFQIIEWGMGRTKGLLLFKMDHTEKWCSIESGLSRATRHCWWTQELNFASLANLNFIVSKLNVISVQLYFICAKFKFTFSKLNFTFAKWNSISARLTWKWYIAICNLTPLNYYTLK